MTACSGQASNKPRNDVREKRPHADLEPWFPIPHYVVDDLAPILSGPHFKVLVFLFRKIAGWTKESDFISLSQIQAGAGVSRKVAVDSLKFFRDAGIIGKRRGTKCRGTNHIFLIRRADPAKVTGSLRELVGKGKKGRLRFTQETKTGLRSELSLVHGVNTQKERLKRNRKDGASAPPLSLGNEEVGTETAKADFLRELARVAGKKAIL